jgi:hypothetical protein
MPDPTTIVSRTLTYDREAMAERGRRGGLTKAERARPAVTLTGAEAAALSAAYGLLGRIAARHRQIADSTPPTDTQRAD